MPESPAYPRSSALRSVSEGRKLFGERTNPLPSVGLLLAVVIQRVRLSSRLVVVFCSCLRLSGLRSPPLAQPLSLFPTSSLVHGFALEDVWFYPGRRSSFTHGHPSGNGPRTPDSDSFCACPTHRARTGDPLASRAGGGSLLS